jgi:hypothetical protein
LGNVDFCAADAFYLSAAKDLVKNLLVATGKYYFQLLEGTTKAPEPTENWIKFEAPKLKPSEVAAAKLQPKMLIFDEKDGT